ncbi:uroporphyrinogen decarboxylase/cobalamine-independent methonine synthase family protein [Oerskovia turbata]
MTAVSGHGPWPGGEGADVLEAQQTIFGELADAPTGVDAVPFLAQFPQRGPGADAVGRTATLLADLPVEIGPHGWKLADRPGMDERRALAFLRDDLGALAIAGHGHAGPLTVSVVGPWTLAAELYLARGDRVLADRGATADLAASLAVGVREHLDEVRRQVPGAEVVVQLAEPLLGQVNAGVLPTFSGYSRLRAVEGPEIVAGLEPVLGATRDGGARSVVHVGPAWVGIAPAVLAGADAVGLDLAARADGWDEKGWELAARAVERGVGVWAGLPPAKVSQCSGPALGELAALVTVPWRRIGLPAAGLDDVTLLAAPRPGGVGLGGAARLGSVDENRAMLGNLGRVAQILAERAQD